MSENHFTISLIQK